jgi:sarcosine oxidase subunit gamma
VTEHVPASALDGFVPPDGAAAAGISERRGLTLLLLRGRASDPAFLARAKTALALDVPVRTGHTASNGAVTVCALGPDEWFVEGRSQELLPSRLSDLGLVVTDVSQGRTMLRIAGPDARDWLAQGCPIDLHPAAFPPGACAQTAIARMPCLLLAVDATPTFDVSVSRSYARSFWDWLATASGLSPPEHRGTE